jgi:hypothetical protein
MEAPRSEATAAPQPNERREAGRRRRDGASLTNGPSAETPGKEDRRAARAARRADDQQRPRAPRASRSAATISSQSLEVASTESGSDSGTTNGAALLNETTVLDLKGKGGAKTAARVQKRQQAAAVALDNLDHDAALGALNRHLNTVTQQITAAHRVIGRVTAERDALRQQLADLKGVPVDEIVVTTVAAAQTASSQAHHEKGERAHHEHGNGHGNGHELAEPHTPSLMERMNFFGGEDFEQMRKRRQLFVLGLAIFGAVLAVIARQVGWSMPDDISRGSLSSLPFLGNLMTVFLGGWVMYRVIRVSSKGVRWVFPSEPRNRRRH